jgi:hypothetical protein
MDLMGKKVKDKISGFEGIVTGIVDYLTGCKQLLIQPPAKDGEFKSSIWIDIDRVEVIGDGIKKEKVSSKKNPGFDSPAPAK